MLRSEMKLTREEVVGRMGYDPMVETKPDRPDLFAWIGLDEITGAEVGLKQGFTPCGLIPLVASKPGRMDQDYIVAQLKDQAVQYANKITLARYSFVSVEMVVG